MAIDPDSIINEQEKPPTEKDIDVADKLEKLIDGFLNANFYAGGFCNFYCQEDLAMTAIREISKRYRDAGWIVVVGSANALDYSKPVFSFFKKELHDDGVIQTSGTS